LCIGTAMLAIFLIFFNDSKEGANGKN
jgi:hypothetical protein